MTSPLISFVTYTNNPDRVIELCKFFEEHKSLSSWELIIGADTAAAFGERWLRIKHTLEKSPKASLHLFDLPAEKTVGDRLQLLFNETNGFYYCIFEHDYLPTQDFVNFTETLEAEDKVHLGSMVNEEGEVRIPSVARGYDFYQSKTFPRGIMLFPRTLISRLGGINKFMNHAHTYDLACRIFSVGEELVNHPRAFTLAGHLHEMSDEEHEALGQVGHGYFYALISKDAKDQHQEIADIVLDGQAVLENHIEIRWTGAKLTAAEGWDIPDQSIGILRAADVLNKIQPASVFQFMEECWRVLAPGGWLLTNTPSTNGVGAFADPRNVSYWNASSFGIFCLTQEAPQAAQFNGHFEHTRVWENYPSAEHQKNDYRMVYAELRRLEKTPPS